MWRAVYSGHDVQVLDLYFDLQLLLVLLGQLGDTIHCARRANEGGRGRRAGGRLSGMVQLSEIDGYEPPLFTPAVSLWCKIGVWMRKDGHERAERWQGNVVRRTYDAGGRGQPSRARLMDVSPSSRTATPMFKLERRRITCSKSNNIDRGRR